MQHQSKKILMTSKHKSHNKNLHKKVLNNKDVKSVKKNTGNNSSNVEGKKMHKILESESLDVPQDTVGFK